MLFLAALLVALPLAAAQQAAPQPTGDLYLTTDGTLARDPGTEGTCLALTGANPQPASNTWTGQFGEGEIRPLAESITLVLALAGANGPAQSGSGFTLEGQLQFGEAAPLAAEPQRFGAGQAPPTASLTFPAEESPAGTGPLQLTVTLTPASAAGPLPGVGQDVRVVCGSPNSKIASFNLAAPAPAAPGEGEDEHGNEGGPVSLTTVMAIALLAGAATLIAGALVLAGRTISQRRIHVLLGATAGLLLAIALVDLLPEAVEMNEAAPHTVAFGVLGLFLVKWAAGDHTHGHGNGRRHEHADHDIEALAHHDHGRLASHSTKLALIAFFALSFHRFVDGLVLPAAFELDSVVGFAAAGAVLIHQFPDGIAAASVFLAAGWRRLKVIQGVGVMAILTPVGALVGLFFLGTGAVVGHLVALAAATFIFIALAELLPELQGPEHRFPVGVGFTLGFAGAFALTYIASLFGVH